VIAIISDAYSTCSAEMKLKKVNITKEMYFFVLDHIESIPFGVGNKIQRKRHAAERMVKAEAERLLEKSKPTRLLGSADLGSAENVPGGAGGRYAEDLNEDLNEEMPWTTDQLTSVLAGREQGMERMIDGGSGVRGAAVKAITAAGAAVTVSPRRSVKKIGAGRSARGASVKGITASRGTLSASPTRSVRWSPPSHRIDSDETAVADGNWGANQTLAGAIARELAAFKTEMRQGQAEMKKELASLRHAVEPGGSGATASLSSFWGSSPPTAPTLSTPAATSPVERSATSPLFGMSIPGL
jgi:hypothetical protein